jgi:hypothetical protein
VPIDDAGSYWIARGQQNFGPYTGAQVRAYLQSGNIAPTDLLRGENETEWTPVAVAIGAATPPSHPSLVPLATGAAMTGDAPPVSYIWGALVTIFCCNVLGVISLIYAGMANTELARGNMPGYHANRRTSFIWLWVALGIGIVFSVLYAVIVVGGAVAGGGGTGGRPLGF